jgi:hypothetical protein
MGVEPNIKGHPARSNRFRSRNPRDKSTLIRLKTGPLRRIRKTSHGKVGESFQRLHVELKCGANVVSRLVNSQRTVRERYSTWNVPRLDVESITGGCVEFVSLVEFDFKTPSYFNSTFKGFRHTIAQRSTTTRSQSAQVFAIDRGTISRIVTCSLMKDVSRSV